MQTKFTPLVKLKLSKLQESELALQHQLQRIQNAKQALEQSLLELEQFSPPKDGSMQEFLASRELLDAQRKLIQHNKDWVAYEEQQLEAIQEAYKLANIEYEKYKYLDSLEKQKIKKAQALKEAKLLDEVALMTYTQKEAI